MLAIKLPGYVTALCSAHDPRLQILLKFSRQRFAGLECMVTPVIAI